VRRFPAPWKVEPPEGGGYEVIDTQTDRPWLMCKVMPVDKRYAETAKALDEARRIESNIAKLPKLLGKD
jgi:hypothetical protein